MSSKPSSAARPDLDWSQVKETVLMLKLAAAQVKFSLQDGDSSVNVLTDSFTSMASGIAEIEKATAGLFETCAVEDNQRQVIEQHCQKIAEKMHGAIIAFQFYDLLVQRLGHVVTGLSDLEGLVGDSSKLYLPGEWKLLQERIRGRYSMDRERELFDAIVAGEDLQQVLDRVLAEQGDKQDDIELF